MLSDKKYLYCFLYIRNNYFIKYWKSYRKKQSVSICFVPVQKFIDLRLKMYANRFCLLLAGKLKEMNMSNKEKRCVNTWAMNQLLAGPSFANQWRWIDILSVRIEFRSEREFSPINNYVLSATKAVNIFQHLQYAETTNVEITKSSLYVDGKKAQQ